MTGPLPIFWAVTLTIPIWLGSVVFEFSISQVSVKDDGSMVFKGARPGNAAEAAMDDAQRIDIARNLIVLFTGPIATVDLIGRRKRRIKSKEGLSGGSDMMTMNMNKKESY